MGNLENSSGFPPLAWANFLNQYSSIACPKGCHLSRYWLFNRSLAFRVLVLRVQQPPSSQMRKQRCWRKPGWTTETHKPKGSNLSFNSSRPMCHEAGNPLVTGASGGPTLLAESPEELQQMLVFEPEPARKAAEGKA